MWTRIHHSHNTSINHFQIWRRLVNARSDLWHEWWRRFFICYDAPPPQMNGLCPMIDSLQRFLFLTRFRVCACVCVNGVEHSIEGIKQWTCTHGRTTHTMAPKLLCHQDMMTILFRLFCIALDCSQFLLFIFQQLFAHVSCLFCCSTHRLNILFICRLDRPLIFQHVILFILVIPLMHSTAIVSHTHRPHTTIQSNIHCLDSSLSLDFPALLHLVGRCHRQSFHLFFHVLQLQNSLCTCDHHHVYFWLYVDVEVDTSSAANWALPFQRQLSSSERKSKNRHLA